MPRKGKYIPLGADERVVVGSNLERLLIESRRAKKELAAEINVDAHTVGTWLSGKSMHRKWLQPLAEIFTKWLGQTVRTDDLLDPNLEAPSMIVGGPSLGEAPEEYEDTYLRPDINLEGVVYDSLRSFLTSRRQLARHAPSSEEVSELKAMRLGNYEPGVEFWGLVVERMRLDSFDKKLERL